MNAPLKTETALERALNLARAGCYVFPSWRKDRHIAGWPSRATRDEATIRAWFSGQYAECWPSIYTGCFGDGTQALLVVDVDPRGLPTIESGALEALLPDTRVHGTPREGLHGFYIVPAPGVKSGVNVLADAIDIRSKGGLVHFGQGYVIKQDEPIAQAPASLIARCGELAPATAPADRAQDRIAPDQEAAMQRGEEIMRTWPNVPAGERNVALRDFVYRVRELCATDADSTLALGLAFAAERCDPPYPEDEARATIRSAMKSAQNAAGSKVALPEDFPLIVQDAAAAAIEKASGRKPRRFLGVDEYTADATGGADYLIKGVLSRRSHALLFGAPGEGKTFLALDMAYAVAQGREWCGRRVPDGGALVIYIPFEGAGGLKKRLKALRQQYGAAEKFRIVENPDYNLCEKSGREALGADIREALGGESPAFIILDTLARSFSGDENSAQDIGALNAAVAALIEASGAAVMLLHHLGKDRARGARGSTAIIGAADTAMEAEGGQLTATKQRDSDEGPITAFRLRPVPVGEDADGEPVTSCIVEPSGRAPRAAWKPTGQPGDAWNVLCRLRPNNDPLPEPEWKAAFVAEAWRTEPPGEAAERKAWQRALKALGERVERTPDGWQRVLE